MPTLTLPVRLFGLPEPVECEVEYEVETGVNHSICHGFPASEPYIHVDIRSVTETGGIDHTEGLEDGEDLRLCREIAKRVDE